MSRRRLLFKLLSGVGRSNGVVWHCTGVMVLRIVLLLWRQRRLLVLLLLLLEGWRLLSQVLRCAGSTTGDSVALRGLPTFDDAAAAMPST